MPTPTPPTQPTRTAGPEPGVGPSRERRDFVNAWVEMLLGKLRAPAPAPEPGKGASPMARWRRDQRAVNDAEDPFPDRCPCLGRTEVMEQSHPHQRSPGQGYTSFAVTCIECFATGPPRWAELASEGFPMAVSAWNAFLDLAKGD